MIVRESGPSVELIP